MKQFAVWLVLGNLCYGTPPNILFIAVDDLNSWTGFAGDPNAITPNMDKLASEGVVFSRAYCTYPLCGPSRASLMSGVYFSELHTSELQPDDSEVEEKIEALGSSLLHTYMGNHGYKTMAAGKILHNHVPSGSVDLSGGRAGWDVNEDADGNRIRSNWPPDLNPDTAVTLTDWGVYVGENGTGTEADMSDSKTAAWAVTRLQETHAEPFMLMVGLLHPHVPWYAPQRYFDMYDRDKLIMPPYNPDDWDDIPAAGLANINDGYPRTEWAIENNQWTNMVHAYLANITFADTKIGMVLDALEASPYKTNTIVVLWGDHGYHMGEKNTFQKHTLWDRSGVTPLIIKAPGMATNALCSSVVSLLDIYPTLVDLCGLPPNEKTRGRTLRPLLEDPARPWNYPAFTYKLGTKAVEYGDARYIEYEDGSQELYDHSSDPDEWTNLVDNVNYGETIITLQSLSPWENRNFEFLDDGPLDQAGVGGSFTVEGLTLSTVDIIGLDGSRASSGLTNTAHLTQTGSSHGLGINTDAPDKAILFQFGEAWEVAFDRDVNLQNINLGAMDADGATMTLTSGSGGFAPITLTGGNGDYDLKDTFVEAGSTLRISYSVDTGNIDDGAQIMSLEVTPIATATNTALPFRGYRFELVADGAVFADQSTGNSANASVIHVPDWIPPAQRAATNANYYMYYGNHSGHFIQMKWAETLEGPWTDFHLGGIYNAHEREGVFDTDSDATRDDYDHVFSPDVHVDDVNQRIILYYHGENQPSTTTLTTGQVVPRQHANFVATSHWGLNFNDPVTAGGESGRGPVSVTFDGITRDVFLANDYQHVFEYRGNYYSLSKRAELAMAPDPANPWAPRPDDPETPLIEPFEMAWIADTTPSALWTNDAHPAGQTEYHSPPATFLASSEFANHPNNPHPGMRIFSEDQDDSLRLNHCSVNVIPEKEQLEVFFYVRATEATDLYDDVYRIVLDISDLDFQQWTVATNSAGLYMFDVVVADDEIAVAVQAANPGADPDDFADPSSMGMPAVFVDDDGKKYVFCTYYSAANGGNSQTSEGQIMAIRIIPAYEGYAEWMVEHFPEGYPGPAVDNDLDGSCNLAEFITGTDPKDPNAFFRISKGPFVQDGFAISWPSVSGRLYNIYWTDRLTNSWSMVINGLRAQGSWIDTIHPAQGTGFYRITAEMED